MFLIVPNIFSEVIIFAEKSNNRRGMIVVEIVCKENNI